ncbi:PREDICTED: probable inactive ATP-dependent zinc metalloprotease FTSHI 5, chloroplastic [Nelumbo nucifera]|uniref:Probable inactive ATP-dependent zinc metalloprotease FTSHI 5, chloroplastic n=1 Tax=Nelumbo nucifera TaxID=4432 RepID=A0A1U8Q926_NELNU|nr:PREDICTED: probable inactive ATP-dependent zinc metalloprotease FTSHI 5, chloroplastic [Nelumbo nucifera]
MESICSSCSAFSGTHLFPLTSRVNLLSLTSSRYSSNLNFFRRKHRHFRRFRGESSDKRRILIQTTKNFGTFASTAFFSDSKSIREDSSVSFPVNFPNAESNLLESVRKAIVLAVFFVAVGFLPNRILLRPAIAAVSVVSREEVRRKEEESNIKDHEYSDYTRRLLETVSRLIQKIGEVRLSKGDLKGVKEALKEVNSKRKELQEEILKRLNAELRELRGEKAALVKQSGDIIDSVLRVKKEQEKLSRKLGGREKLKKQTETLEESMIASEKEYNAIWEKVSGIEDKMLRRETMAFSVGIRELSFIERESELLVERFNRELRRRRVEKHGRIVIGAQVKKWNPNVLCLQETKLETMELSQTRSIWGDRNCDWECVPAIGTAGGLVIVWDPDVVGMKAKRMKPVMGHVTSEFQGAFVEGRQMVDGVLIAKELIDSRIRSGRAGLLCKMDPEKSIRSCELGFFGLHFKENELQFQVEELDEGKLTWRAVPGVFLEDFRVGENRLEIPLLHFADDSVFFFSCNASREQIDTLMAILWWFDVVSGLHLNVHKSELVAVGEGISAIPSLFENPFWRGMRRGWLDGNRGIHQRELGLPDPIERKMREFLWKGWKESKKVHLVNWGKVCKQKKKGGLGRRKIREMNLAFLGKWFWRFGHQRNCLWKRVIEAKYGSRNEDWVRVDANQSYGCSVWKGIEKSYSAFSKEIKFVVGRGTRVTFWLDHWCGNNMLKDDFQELFAIAANKEAKVAEYVQSQNGHIPLKVSFFIWDAYVNNIPTRDKLERILLDRDRVVAKTWYNEEKNRWEMDSIAVPYAVSKKLVENVRIRHDWAAMYIALKGDDKEYYVDIQEFEMLFEDFGGFDGLYLKMLASGIPTAVQLMHIPLSELDIRQQFFLAMRLSRQCLVGLWKSGVVQHVKRWVFEKIKNINDDIMMMIIFPIVEFIIPFPVRMNLGMAWPEDVDQATASTWYLKWQSDAEINFKSRKGDDIQWFLWFLIRSIVYGYVLFNVLRFLKRKIPRFLGYGPLRRNPNLRKLRRVKAYFRFKLRRRIRRKKEGIDPIRSAFDQMKRVKNPPIRLKDFASVESMREEINEVVAFLQNPSAFREMGACAPRGVLIVGERGTGKTSLALAIAAEAKVPVVEVKAQQLEAGLWVGQSASNVRELFQTARDLAPVIIFVEDFDLFAGVRGKFIHTKEQDHEAFINQLLVELDGFEKQDGVVLMATTRNLKQIDQALQRPGRMDRIFHLQRPTQLEREKILRIAAKESMDHELIELVDWKKVAEKTALLRPVELKLVPLALEGSAFRSKFLDTDELISYCGWFASFSDAVPKWLREIKIVKGISRWLVNHLGLTLTKDDMQNVVDLMEPYGQISNGIELLNPPLDWTRETKFPHAVWAAGRGLIALILPNFDVVDNIWLEPFSWEGIGCTKITKAKDEESMNGNVETRSYLEKKLVFCFGSYVAAQMLLPFGEENFLSSSELKQAQEIATRMVIQYGWGPDESPTIYFCSNATTALSMGNNHEFEMAAKVEKIYDSAYDKAKNMLQKNRKVLEKIVEELLEFEILTGKDLQRIFYENGGIQEKEPFFLSNLYDKELESSYSVDGRNASATALLGLAT